MKETKQNNKKEKEKTLAYVTKIKIHSSCEIENYIKRIAFGASSGMIMISGLRSVKAPPPHRVSGTLEGALQVLCAISCNMIVPVAVGVT